MSFLKAEWRKLALANYEVDPEILKPYLPYKTELDIWNNTCYVSLVGFMFINTSVFGVKFPYHVNFEEINLRFYVRHNDGKQWKRGVVFVSEIVPKPLISFVANTLYNEHYTTRKMFHKWEETENTLETSYGFFEKGRAQSIAVSSSKIALPFPAESETEFITEHYWGYTPNSEKETTEYEVTHPRWNAYEVLDYNIDFDFELAYGLNFGILNELEPRSVMLAEGSEITVESKKILK
ncbi:MAG: DUF2071 domain-containing protein [Bacteroidia bacterium]|nr:DUF2071 domain-containing protein [Bacteroidia bacterium]NNF30297.1 DUF2071 domain-containing protein [Flavobacteriaceae bacterium]MBT8276373.1 DUF2071 domain-containing protein [Bacteroidia bacterium]NNJ80972.1 DUF2071 domain-containing protein [Flavobacteriaceae bacterium]NNK53558.1 DUF2071 domain-containing protein [Flavobacteriaceae bacterium]